MQITIDTQNLSSLDTEVLRLLTGEKVAESATEPMPAKKAEEKSAPKPKGAAKKAAAAKKDKPEPEPEPEPMAEEPVEDEPEEAEETDEDEEQSDEELLDLAIKKATDMVSAGDAAKVREALDSVGVNRARELNKDNVREFFKALP